MWNTYSSLPKSTKSRQSLTCVPTFSGMSPKRRIMPWKFCFLLRNTGWAMWETTVGFCWRNWVYKGWRDIENFPILTVKTFAPLSSQEWEDWRKYIKKLSPQVSGMVAFALRLWGQGRNDVAWCPVHIPNGIPLFSIKECLQTCPVCKKVMESLASTTSRGEMYEACKPSEGRSSYTDHFDSNFNSVMKNLFDLVD